MDNVFIESADFDLGDGEEFQFIRRCIPDVKFTGDSGSDQTMNFVIKARNFPGDSLPLTKLRHLPAAPPRLMHELVAGRRLYALSLMMTEQQM